jgi:hypothetical protein
MRHVSYMQYYCEKHYLDFHILLEIKEILKQVIFIYLFIKASTMGEFIILSRIFEPDFVPFLTITFRNKGIKYSMKFSQCFERPVHLF